MPKALFIGRFQPFHLGHLDALKQISENEIIVGIGSSQYSDTAENPYSFAERKKMVELIAKNIPEKNIKIIAIPDIHNSDKWVEYIKNITPNFDIVYTGNNFVAKLFQEKNYLVKPITIQQKISGTRIRHMIKNNNLDWKKQVPLEIIILL